MSKKLTTEQELKQQLSNKLKTEQELRKEIQELKHEYEMLRYGQTIKTEPSVRECQSPTMKRMSVSY